VQDDSIKPALTALATGRLKLKCDRLLSNVAFNFKSRRCLLGESYRDGLGVARNRVKANEHFHMAMVLSSAPGMAVQADRRLNPD